MQRAVDVCTCCTMCTCAAVHMLQAGASCAASPLERADLCMHLQLCMLMQAMTGDEWRNFWIATGQPCLERLGFDKRQLDTLRALLRKMTLPDCMFHFDGEDDEVKAAMDFLLMKSGWIRWIGFV